MITGTFCSPVSDIVTLVLSVRTGVIIMEK